MSARRPSASVSRRLAAAYQDGYAAGRAEYTGAAYDAGYVDGMLHGDACGYATAFATIQARRELLWALGQYRRYRVRADIQAATDQLRASLEPFGRAVAAFNRAFSAPRTEHDA